VTCAQYPSRLTGRRIPNGCGNGCGDHRRNRGATRGDGDGKPAGGTKAASHRLSFLARGRAQFVEAWRYAENVSGNDYHGIPLKVKPISTFFPEIPGYLFRNVPEHASMNE
jgi:hypothetical protein